jgi:hypothetical protein
MTQPMTRSTSRVWSLGEATKWIVLLLQILLAFALSQTAQPAWDQESLRYIALVEQSEARCT